MIIYDATKMVHACQKRAGRGGPTRCGDARGEPGSGLASIVVESYKYDKEEIFGTPSDWGYALAYRNRRQEALKIITDALRPGSTILDLAAAQGNFTLALAERGYRVT